MTTREYADPSQVLRGSRERLAVERVHPPRWFIRNFINPIARKILPTSTGRISKSVLLLRFAGRRSGRNYEVPVGYRRIDGRLALLTDSRWRHNFEGGKDVEVCLAGAATRAHATLEKDATTVARTYQRLVHRSSELDDPVTYKELGLKVNVDREPTLGELTELAARSHLSIIWLDVLAAP